MKKEYMKKVGGCWSEVSLKKQPKNIRWWEFPTIHNHINQLICGKSTDHCQGLLTNLKNLGLTFEHGVSVGCGNAQKELALINQGLVKKFTLFELSDVRIKLALDQVKLFGLEKNVKIVKGNCFDYKFSEDVDFVYWSQSLHHMLDVEKAVKWSNDILKVSGVFFMEDYVGASRFQWDDDALELCNRIRSTLPDIYLKDPYDPDKLLNRVISRPDPEKLAEIDPSEAADSGKILKSVMKYFPNADITLTGGTIYHAALNDVLHNIDESNIKDKCILDLLLLIDEFATKSGIESHYATAIAVKI